MSQVSICDKKKVPLLLTADDGTVRWVKALGGSRDTVAPFDAKAIGELAKSHELVATDAALEAAAEASDGAVWDVLGHIYVFARMSPTGKAKVIRMMQERGGHRVLMCGDGGNDCGALKQADIGLALLSGYGDVNTLGDGTKADGGKKAEESLNAQAKEIARKSAESAKIQRAALAAKQKELQALQQVWMREEVAAAEARGEDLGMSGHFRIMKSSLARMQRELVAERRRLQAVHGNVFDQKDAVAKMTAELGAEDSALPMVRRRPHRPISRAIASRDSSSERAGRCARVLRSARATRRSLRHSRPARPRCATSSTSSGRGGARCCLRCSNSRRANRISAEVLLARILAHASQIMMLESLISAYVLSALSLEGARSSERQVSHTRSTGCHPTTPDRR